MNDKQVVRIDELEMAANDIKNKRDMILSIYETVIKKVLYQSEDYFVKSNQNYNDVENTFKDLFSKFDLSVTELTDLLTNKIIPNYQDLIISIRRSFNKQFASEMTELLGLEDNSNE